MAGAERYRNPDEDLPRDFEERRADYYRELGRDQDARAFVEDLKAQMAAALRRLNAEIPFNPKVRILWRGKNRISITPFDPLPPAPTLDAVKAELERRWPMTELIDVLMETAHGPVSWMRLPPRVIGWFLTPTRSGGAWSCAYTDWEPMLA